MVIDVTETGQYEEPFDVETVIADSTTHIGSMRRKIAVNREWIQSYHIEAEKAQRIAGDISAGFLISTIKVAAEQAIISRYSVSKEVRQARHDEIDVDVPANTRVTVLIYWKRKWRRGMIKLRDQQHREIVVPFQIVVGLSLDSKQSSEK